MQIQTKSYAAALDWATKKRLLSIDGKITQSSTVINLYKEYVISLTCLTFFPFVAPAGQAQNSFWRNDLKLCICSSERAIFGQTSAERLICELISEPSEPRNQHLFMCSQRFVEDDEYEFDQIWTKNSFKYTENDFRAILSIRFVQVVINSTCSSRLSSQYDYGCIDLLNRLSLVATVE